MTLDTTWKKWVYRFGMISVGLMFPLGTIVVGLQFFVIGEGKDNWKSTEANLIGAVEYIFYIFGYVFLFAIVVGGLTLLFLK